MAKHRLIHRRGFVAVASLAMVIALAFAASVRAEPGNKLGGCSTNDTWTLVDFVYSGNYKATGLYEFGWVTYPELGAANQEFFGGSASGRRTSSGSIRSTTSTTTAIR